jgi:ABC-2 type transport system ATP-binding protein
MSTGPGAAIEVEHLRKAFRGHQALDGVDLTVAKGSLLGLLGPNGAGKSTMVRVLSTLLAPDSGRAVVAGFDVVRQARQVRERIGLAGQYPTVDEHLTGRENLVMLGRLLHLGRHRASERAQQLLARFRLTEAADRALRTYSGGMRRRLDLAACLVGDPEILFLDEPTTGLDPASRLELWGTIRELLSANVTVLLTTQYLEEADHLADRIAVVAGGKLIAEGTAQELKRSVGEKHLDVTLADPADLSRARSVLATACPGELQVDERRSSLGVTLHTGLVTVGLVAEALHAGGVDVAGLEMRGPTLDDVFLRLTGQPGTVPAAAAG